MITITGLTKKYYSNGTETTALDDINLKLPNTGLVAIYGENGCGKTTLLNIISTADTEYKGAVSYNNTDYSSIIPEIRRNVVSFVLQEKHFIPYLNLRDNIALFSDDEDDELICAELEKFSILEKKTEDPNNLSGGQRQRSSIIRGIVKKSEILLVDEPTSSLNEEMELAVFRKLQEYAKEKLVVIVSHNIKLIRSFADLIIHMDQGKIQSVETNSKADIQYSKDEISVPYGFIDISALDMAYVKETLAQNKPIVISPCGERTTENVKMDYSVCNTHPLWKSPKKIPAALNKKLIFSSLKHIKGTVIFGICLISLIVVLMNFLFSFTYFDENEFVYQSISNNIEGYANFHRDYTVYAGKSPAYMNLPTYSVYHSRFPESKFLLVDYSMEQDFQFRFSMYYGNSIYGVSFCNSEDVDLAAGLFCKAGEILITDYSADALISNLSDYTDYDSIIEQGVMIGNIHYDVAGIVDTDYEKYYKEFNNIIHDEDFDKSHKFSDYSLALHDIYCRIYMSLNDYLSSDEILCLELNEDGAFYSARYIENYSSLFVGKTVFSNTCYINKALYNTIGDIEYFKLINFELDIIGVIDDGEDEGFIYMSKGTRESIAKATFSIIETVVTKLSSADEVAFLRDFNLIHNTSISTYMNDVVDIIKNTLLLFVFIIVILSAFLIGAVVFLNGKILSSDNTTIALLKSAGYETKSIFLLEAYKIAIMCAASCVVSCLMYIINSFLTNWLLSALFGFDISISLISAKAMAASVLILLAAYALVSALMFISKSKKEITELLKS